MPEKIKKIRGSKASYKYDDGLRFCDLEELCEIYSNYKNIPKKLSNISALEIWYLVQDYLKLKENESKKIKRKK